MAAKKSRGSIKCVCGIEKHESHTDSDFHVTRKNGSIAKAWTTALGLKSSDILRDRVYVHFSHFSVLDYGYSANASGSWYLLKSSVPSASYSDHFDSKSDFFLHLAEVRNASQVDTNMETHEMTNLCVCQNGSDCQQITAEYRFHYLP